MTDIANMNLLDFTTIDSNPSLWTITGKYYLHEDHEKIRVFKFFGGHTLLNILYH